MHDPLETISRARTTVQLSDDHKAATRSYLERVTAAMPIRERAPWYGAAFLRPVAVSMAAIVVVVASGGVVALAAESARPGDALYGVKIGINEQVRLALATTPEAKSQVTTMRVERRLTEAAALVRDGELSPERAVIVQRGVENATTDAAVYATTLQASGDIDGAVEVVSRLEGIIAAHDTILARVDSTTDEGALRPRLARRLAALGEVRVALESSVLEGSSNASPTASSTDETPSARASRERITQLANRSTQAAARAQQAAQQRGVSVRRADQAAALSAQAQEELLNGNLSAALKLSTRALRDAEESRALVTAQHTLGLPNTTTEDEDETSAGDDDRATGGDRDGSHGGPGSTTSTTSITATTSTTLPQPAQRPVPVSLPTVRIR